MHRKTRRSFNTPYDAHGLTFSTYHRLPVFEKTSHCVLFLEALESAADKMEFDLWSYVVMPDHIHLLIFPRREVYDMALILKEIKAPSARAIFACNPELRCKMLVKRSNGRVEARLWQQGGGYDRNFRSGEDIWEFMEYVHNNPLAAGLCERIEDWPWSSARYYAGEPNKLVVRCPWFSF